MFAQEGAYGEYVDKFFAENPHPNISWINDIGKRRYGAAANALFGESGRTGDLEPKHVRLAAKCGK
jgi:nuclear pore complex protein Nup133